MPKTARATARIQRDEAILELTFGRIRTWDDNYVVFERHADGIDVGAVLRRLDGVIVAQAPDVEGNKASDHANLGYMKSVNQVAMLGATAAALVADAKNSDKTSAAAVSFLSSFSALKFPAYHQADAQYRMLILAGYDAACYLIKDLRPNLATVSDPEQQKALQGLQPCPPDAGP